MSRSLIKTGIGSSIARAAGGLGVFSTSLHDMGVSIPVFILEFGDKSPSTYTISKRNHVEVSTITFEMFDKTVSLQRLIEEAKNCQEKFNKQFEYTSKKKSLVLRDCKQY